MPRMSNCILSTDREVRNIRSGAKRSEYRIKDAPGLILRVTPKGRKSWTFLYRCPLSGTRRKMSIGTYPDTSLSVARSESLAARLEVQKGKDPRISRTDQQSTMSVRALSEAYIAFHVQKNVRGDVPSKGTIEAQRILDKDILPFLGGLNADAVTKRHVLDVMNKVLDRGAPVAADRLLGLIRAMFNWAQATDLAERNPTTGLKKLNASRPRERVLTDNEIVALVSYFSRMGAPSVAIRDALHLQLLLGQRVSEITQARKVEIDLSACVWIVPGRRTKSNRKHVVPLPIQALSILSNALRRSPESEWLFPSRYGNKNPIDSHSATAAMHRACDRIGIERAGTHDLRRTVATGLGELGVHDEVIVRILNHAPRSVLARHYNHAQRQKDVRAALQLWADRIDKICRVPPTTEAAKAA